MPLVDILRAMEAEAARERESILAESRSAAGRVLAQASAEVEALRHRRLEAERRVLEAERARRLSEVRLVGLREVAAARERQVEAVFEQAAARLGGLRGTPCYRSVLWHLIAEAAADLGGGPFVVSVDPADAALAGELLAELGLDGSVAPVLSCAGGVEVGDTDGRVVVRGTFEDRLRRARDVLRAEVYTALSESAVQASGTAARQ